MGNSIKHSGAIILKPLASDPSDATEGMLYYNSSSKKFKLYEDSAFKEVEVKVSLTANRLVVTDGSGALTVASVTDTEAGYLSGVTSSIQTQLGTKQNTSEKGAANGYASLDAGGKIPSAQLPASIMQFQGNWDANTNSPTLADGSGDQGDVYRVSVAGSQDLGSGSISFDIGDWVMYNGTIWEKGDNSDAVTSVAGKTGAVTLDTDDVSEATALYFTDARAKAAAVLNTLAGSETDQAPSVNAVNTALSAKLENVVEDTTPQLGGNLDANGKAIEDASNELVIAGQNMIRRAKQASKGDFIEEEYLQGISLLASQSGTTIASLTFAHASYEFVEIVYRLKEGSTGNVRCGTLRVVTDGTNVSISDVSNEAGGDTGVVFSAAVNGANVEVRYDTGSNAVTMRADVKRLKA